MIRQKLIEELLRAEHEPEEILLSGHAMAELRYQCHANEISLGCIVGNETDAFFGVPIRYDRTVPAGEYRVLYASRSEIPFVGEGSNG